MVREVGLEGMESKRPRDGKGGGGKRARVGEQYLGDFALYLEMSFVGSISSTIRTLAVSPTTVLVSICVYICVYICVCTNRYTMYIEISMCPSLLPFRSSAMCIRE